LSPKDLHHQDSKSNEHRNNGQPGIVPTTVIVHQSSFIIKLWVLLVDHKFQAIGDFFPVDTSDNIHHLKMKVKEERQNDLAHVDVSTLTVWMTKGTMIINKPSFECLAEILGNINIHDKDTIKKLDGFMWVVDLGLADGQTLLV